MDLTLTALIKAIILHWGRGSSSGDTQLETQQKSSKFKTHQLLLPLSSINELKIRRRQTPRTADLVEGAWGKVAVPMARKIALR